MANKPKKPATDLVLVLLICAFIIALLASIDPGFAETPDEPITTMYVYTPHK